MKFSVVTATWNCEAGVAETVASVARQTDVEIDHVLIDNCSRDRTVELAKAANPAIRVFSGPDNGIYDAFNKGWKEAIGDAVSFLNAGDFYLATDTLAKVAKTFRDHPDAALVHGDIMVNGRLCRPRTGFLSIDGCRILHPATFTRREVLATLGGFNDRYRICADLDLFIRTKKAGHKFVFLDEPLADFALGGVSTTKLFATTRDVVRILEANGFSRAYVAAFRFAQTSRDILSLTRRAFSSGRISS